MRQRCIPLLLAAMLALTACAREAASPQAPAPTSTADSGAPAPEAPVAQAPPADPESVSEPAPVGERVFQRYTQLPADWNEDASAFPAGWIQAALDAVNREWERDTAAFTRGWLCDFAGDGAQEAILLIRALPEDEQDIMGDSQFVYVGGDGRVQPLLGGSDMYGGDWLKLDAWLLQYPGFSHIVLQGGNGTAAGGLYMGIYRSGGDQLEALLLELWIDTGSGLFLTTSGPQGLPTSFYFWDTAYDRYSGIGPVEIAPDAFLEQFDPDGPLPASEEFGSGANTGLIAPENLHPLTAADIDRVEVYGGRYYQVYFSDAYTARHDDIAFAVRRRGAAWELFWGPSIGIMNSIAGSGDRDVHDVDMDAAEQAALPPPGD